jgi:signal peptidase I
VKILRLIITLLIGSLITYFLISHLAFSWVLIDGTSMNPTLKNRQHYILKYYQFQKPQIGDIVIFKDPTRICLNKENQGYCAKRVVAVENQVVFIANNKIHVSDIQFTNHWIKLNRLSNLPPNQLFICHSNEYFVVGDNLNDSVDSRYYGPISIKIIIGKIP